MGADGSRQLQAPPQAADPVKAHIEALKYADTQRKLREARGRRSAFLFSEPSTSSGAGNTGRPAGSAPLLGS